MKARSPRWSVAIFAARESITTLTDCVRAVLGACQGNDVVVDVLVNGNRALAEQATQMDNLNAPGGGNISVHVWFIAVGDKAHTWNQYLHHIWRSGEISYFIDGYTEVRPDALALIYAGLQSAPGALGATGVPTSGRSAHALRRQLLKEGGIHGNLYAVRGEIMSKLKQCGFCKPRGLYRTDALLGAVLAYRLDPAKYEWDIRRMLVHPQATWTVQSTNWWSPKQVLNQYKRTLRQAQGVLENCAVREHMAVKKRSPATLPRSVADLVNSWIADNPQQARRIFLRHPLTICAAHKLKQSRDWSEAGSDPVLLRTIFHISEAMSGDVKV